jgi:hypothetical protein
VAAGELIAAGAPLPPMNLIGADGRMTPSSDLLLRGPCVLIYVANGPPHAIGEQEVIVIQELAAALRIVAGTVVLVAPCAIGMGLEIANDSVRVFSDPNLEIATALRIRSLVRGQGLSPRAAGGLIAASYVVAPHGTIVYAEFSTVALKLDVRGLICAAGSAFEARQLDGQPEN